MSEKLYFSLDIDKSIKDIESLKNDILNLNLLEEELAEIEEVKEETPSLGVVEAILISLAAKFLFELIKKVAPVAIRKLKNLIFKIIEKRKQYSNQEGKLILQYEVLTLTFTTGTEKEVDEEINKLIKYLSD